MCNFLSGIVLRNGDVLTHPMLDSHSDLVRYYQLPDATAYHQHFAKVELTPGDWMDPKTWAFRLDEETAPSWWGDVATGAEETLRARAEKMIIREGTRDLIADGCWIVGGGAVVNQISSGRIVCLYGRVESISGSGRVEIISGSGRVGIICDSGRVGRICDSGRVGSIYGSGRVESIYGSGSVEIISGSGSVGSISDSGRVENDFRAKP